MGVTKNKVGRGPPKASNNQEAAASGFPPVKALLQQGLDEEDPKPEVCKLELLHFTWQEPPPSKVHIWGQGKIRKVQVQWALSLALVGCLPGDFTN
jgi:hypothetical protein